MPMYEVELSYTIPEWGFITVEADSADEAEEIALKEFIAPEDPDYVRDLVVDRVKEVNIG